EVRALRRDPVTGCGHAHRALARDPEHEVDEVDAAAEHHGVPADVTAPAVRDLVQPSVEVVAVERIDAAEGAAFAFAAEETVEGRRSQHEVRGKPQLGVSA